MVTNRFRWAAGTALAAALLVGAGLRTAPAHDTRTQILREAFDAASSHCYDNYRGAALQGCLAGAMQAHLQALGGSDGPEAAGQIERVRAPRGDI
jgi:hypothetical protein